MRVGERNAVQDPRSRFRLRISPTVLIQFLQGLIRPYKCVRIELRQDSDSKLSNKLSERRTTIGGKDLSCRKMNIFFSMENKAPNVAQIFAK